MVEGPTTGTIVANNLGLISANIVSTGGIGSAGDEVAAGGISRCKLLPKGCLSVGRSFIVVLCGTHTAGAARTPTFKVFIGPNGTTGDTLALSASTAATPTTGTNIAYRVQLIFTIRATGSGTSGLASGTLTLINQGTTGVSATVTQVVALTAAGFNTEQNNYITVTFTRSGTGSVNESTFEVATIEMM